MWIKNKTFFVEILQNLLIIIIKIWLKFYLYFLSLKNWLSNYFSVFDISLGYSNKCIFWTNFVNHIYPIARFGDSSSLNIFFLSTVRPKIIGIEGQFRHCQNLEVWTCQYGRKSPLVVWVRQDRPLQPCAFPPVHWYVPQGPACWPGLWLSFRPTQHNLIWCHSL